ncbi:GNAT family N-acetyltransferase [Paenibacillus hamazuiensis]|uniref:GNAT family N-acetyltransferase n=1 Tax=Paenibacillus hamazuiensis TaxID=2936508 RepID=UPI00200ED695|nr:GNAT family N-acetyltransferase [Paenibacillus hamazuiensis]
MGAIVYKEITDEHLEEVAGIYNYFVENTTITFHTECVSVQEMRESVIHPNPRFKSFVVEQDGAIAGYVLIAQHKKKQAYDTSGEVTIYLKPDCVGAGIGAKALQFIEDVARQNGFHVLVVTICTENERSMRLFEKNGYRQCAHFKEIGRKFGRWLDIATYQKILD